MPGGFVAGDIGNRRMTLLTDVFRGETFLESDVLAIDLNSIGLTGAKHAPSPSYAMSTHDRNLDFGTITDTSHVAAGLTASASAPAALAAGTASSLKAVMVGNETFLQSDFLAVGINSSGSIGTKQAAPSGFTTDVSRGYLRLGMVADVDGFGTGKTATPDSIVRGMCIEGFNIGYKTAGKTFVQSNQELDGLTEIKGKATNGSTATVAQADWNGVTTEKLAVDQTITLTEDAKYLRIEVTLTNNSTAAMADLRYMRTVDPDLGEGFSTTNKIVKQGDGGALVTSAASSTGNPMFLYANDSRAVVSTYGFINEDPYLSAVCGTQAVGTTTTKDVSISINFALGTLNPGGSTTVVFYMGVTDNLSATIAEIDSDAPSKPQVPVNVAPDAVDDLIAVVLTAAATGNVLTNDRDSDGDALTATLKTGPAHGTVTIAADGSYTYKAAAGYVGKDSFTYTASDGKASDTATVSVTVTAPPPVDPVLPDSPLVQRANTLNGSASTADTLTGVAQHNSFYFDIAAASGADTIANLGHDDIVVTKGKINDGNGDGIITFSGSKVSLGGTDSIFLPGTSSLRYLGTDAKGLSVYADLAGRPKGAIESKISNDTLTSDAADKIKTVFFFDTALDINLGTDRINNFGAKDLLVTTSALSTTALGSSGVARLVGGSGDASDTLTPGEAGTVELHASNGAAIGAVEFDGSIVRNDVTYYVYSAVGSSAGVADLGF